MVAPNIKCCRAGREDLDPVGYALRRRALWIRVNGQDRYGRTYRLASRLEQLDDEPQNDGKRQAEQK